MKYSLYYKFQTQDVVSKTLVEPFRADLLVSESLALILGFDIPNDLIEFRQLLPNLLL